MMAALLLYGTFYAHSVEQKYIHALTNLRIPQSDLGIALQQIALEHPDLLMIYGSSEMLGGSSPYVAPRFFQNYPTGFNIYIVARPGVTSLDIAEDLAAIGSELRRKKVVFSFTPSMFDEEAVSPASYAEDFSLLHANALIFDLSLSYGIKQLIAQRMNEYPHTLNTDPILQFGVQQLICPCSYGSTLYVLTLPLGQINTWIIRLQDHWDVLNYIWSHPKLNPAVTRKPAQINWVSEIAQSLRVDKTYSTNNPYGIENSAWTNTCSKILAQRRKPGSSDAQFLWNLDHSTEWADFELALRVLKELGAKPIILSRPLDGRIWNAMGVSSLARRVYYDKLQNTIAPYGFPFVDFENHDSDKYFSIDPSSHTSPEGWVYVDQTLDDFFHDKISKSR